MAFRAFVQFSRCKLFSLNIFVDVYECDWSWRTEKNGNCVEKIIHSFGILPVVSRLTVLFGPAIIGFPCCVTLRNVFAKSMTNLSNLRLKMKKNGAVSL